jgi:hypothetical protein
METTHLGTMSWKNTFGKTERGMLVVKLYNLQFSYFAS